MCIAGAPLQVGVDLMLEMLMDAWQQQRAMDAAAAAQAFASLDPSGRGIHSAGDFRKVLRVIDGAASKATPDDVVFKAFREATRLQGGGGCVHSNAFCEVRAVACFLCVLPFPHCNACQLCQAQHHLVMFSSK